MSSNKTIKALREERDALYAAIRQLQVACAGTVCIPATSLKDLKVSQGRVAVAFEFPPLPPLTSQQEAEFGALTNAVAAHYNAPVHAILGFGSREEMEAQHGRDAERNEVVPVADLPPLNFIDVDAPEPVWAHIEHGQWNCDSLAELILETTNMEGERFLKAGTVVWRGTKRFADPAGFVPGSDEIINTMAENAACSDAGEWADDYPNVTDEAKEELNDFMAAWARKHAPVEKFYCVEAIEAYIVTAEDLAQ